MTLPCSTLCPFLAFASQKPPRVIPASVTLSWSPKDNLDRKRPRNRRKRAA